MGENKCKKHLSRREFIKTIGAAGLAAGSLLAGRAGASLSEPSVIGANNRLNYGVIGVGGMGSGHLRMLLELQEEQNIRVVGVSDVYDNRLQEAAKAAGLSKRYAYRDYRRLLEDKSIDVVCVATPDHWHGQICVEAMEAGKHVYVEKPMTRYFSEALKMLDTAKRTRRLVQVGSQGCTDAKWHKAGELIRAGNIGTVIWAQGSYCRNNPTGEWNYNIDPGLTPETCDWNAWLGSAPKRPFSPERYFRWRKYWDYGTGIIGDLWPHRLHPLMIAMAIDDYPARVACIGSIPCSTDKGHGEPRDVAEASLLQVEFPNGAMIFLAGSTVNERGIEDMIRGQKANLYFGGGKVRIEPERPFSDEIQPQDIAISGPGEDQKEHHRNLIHCIRNGGTPNCPVELGTRVMAIVAMAEKSYRERKMVRYNPIKRRIV